jgi:hypothetical protein
MTQTVLGILRKKVFSRAVLTALACGAFALNGHADVVTLTSGTSTAQIDPNSQAGLFNWNVAGANQISQQWFWYGIGNNAPASLDTISPAQLSGVTPNTFTTTYSGGGFSVGVTYALTGAINGAPGPVQSDLGQTIKINNTTASPLVFHLYDYANFTLNGAPNSAMLLQALNGYSIALQSSGASSLAETIVAPPAQLGEAEPVGVTLAKLNNGVNPVTLSGNSVTGLGDVTWALEWDLNIAANSSALISEVTHLDTVVALPEPAVPATLALAIGAAALALDRRRRQRA